MQKNSTRILNVAKRSFLLLCLLSLAVLNVKAQDKDTSTFHPSGHLWGYAFADVYTKMHSDSLNRGGNNQYTGVAKGANAFQFRRIYLGYNYDITRKFSAEFLLAAEDDFSSGDLLANGKFTPYIKLANLRWKQIFPGADFVFGQMATPSFAASSPWPGSNVGNVSSEDLWSYRSIERTVSDIRRTPSYDFGAGLQGKFDPKTGNFGYDLMVANGTSDKPETDKYKWYYADVYAKFLNKKLLVDLYADYEPLTYTKGYKHTRQMTKLFVAYTTKPITIGVEGFINNLQGDDIATLTTPQGTRKADTLALMATALSVWVRGPIVKHLGFFARMDMYNPDANNKVGSTYKAYSDNTATSNYNPTVKETFFTAGLDYQPTPKVHIMPNIWYDGYMSTLSNVSGKVKNDYDLVPRLTFYYIYGK